MSRNRSKRKQSTITRASVPIVLPNGATMYVPPGQAQGILGQTFYGSKANIPVGQTALFSPGQPLAPQPGVDPGGIPVRFPFKIAYNTFPNDRTDGNPDIPSFMQLRMLARMYSGISICERAWFDMVPRMTLKISLKPEYVAQGLEEKDFQEEISYFKRWFERPDGKHLSDDGSATGGKDIHTWIRKALREQTQIDELYVYKHRTRGWQLLGLHVIAGDTIKPLLNDWGDTPAPDDPVPYAFQQYPWGLPGMQYTTDMLLHYQESPAADTVYGQSRVERIIMEVNQALRKKKRDLAMFTEGNIPKAIAEVPETSNWTPDQIDSFEMQWNNLMAGNLARQTQMKFTMPGMKIVQLDNGEIMTEFDQWLLNITTGCYGMSMGDISFTGDIHKSSGDSQQNVLYRRTIDPLATIYAAMLTECMNTDFPPALHGDMFMVGFGGFEEAEDLGSLATAYTTLTNAGILGITNAGKLMKLPEDPDAPHIGRIIITKDGPIFLDDMASDEMRNAAAKAKMAGFELAANPPDPNTQGDEKQNDNGPQQAAKNPQSVQGKLPPGGKADQRTQNRAAPSLRQSADDGRAGASASYQRWSRGTCSCDECQMNDGSVRGAGEAYPSGAMTTGSHNGCDCTLEPYDEEMARADIKRWRDVALKDVKAGKPVRPFVSQYIPTNEHFMIEQGLMVAATPDDVRAVFERTKTYEPSDTGAWQQGDPTITRQLDQLRAQGVTHLTWHADKSACDQCRRNANITVEIGKPFPTGAYLPIQHNHCVCTYTTMKAVAV